MAHKIGVWTWNPNLVTDTWSFYFFVCQFDDLKLEHDKLQKKNSKQVAQVEREREQVGQHTTNWQPPFYAPPFSPALSIAALRTHQW